MHGALVADPTAALLIEARPTHQDTTTRTLRAVVASDGAPAAAGPCHLTLAVQLKIQEDCTMRSGWAGKDKPL